MKSSRQRPLVVGLVLAAGLCFAAAPVKAQGYFISPFPDTSPFRGQFYRPPVSPYLNLFRNDAGLAPNYYTLVRPQLQQLRFNQRESYAVGRLEQATAVLTTRSSQRGDASDLVRPTGHPARFFDYSHYYGAPPYGAGMGPSVYGSR